MLFAQSAAPTGWVKQTGSTYDNAGLRVTTGTVGSGGLDGFTSVFGTGKSTAGFTLGISHIPPHSHPARGGNTNIGTSNSAVTANVGNLSYSVETESKGGGASHSHSLNTMNLKYTDAIVASKS
jgi:hypothetical protein